MLEQWKLLKRENWFITNYSKLVISKIYNSPMLVLSLFCFVLTINTGILVCGLRGYIKFSRIISVASTRSIPHATSGEELLAQLIAEYQQVSKFCFVIILMRLIV